MDMGDFMTKAFLTFAAALALAVPAAAQEANVRLVTMTGTGVVQAEPNRAWVSVGIEARAATTAPARQQAASTMKAIQKRLAALGIPEADIRTSQFNVMQDWVSVQGQRTRRGFVVSNHVEIKVDDIGKLPAVIDESIAAGATNIHGVRWDMANREALERQALQRAYADARARAEVIAAASGSRLGDVFAAEEARFGAIRPRAYVGNAAGVVTESYSTVATSNISPGQIDISATITVSFRLER
jgi:uncharacterized protein YggE